MNAVCNECGDFIGRTYVMDLQSSEEEVMACGLRGFHREEIGPRNRFRKTATGIGAVQRIGRRVGCRSGAVRLCRSYNLLDEGGRHERAGGIMHGDKIRRIRGEGLEAMEHGGAALRSASDDIAELGERSSEFREFRDALRCAHQHGVVDGRAVLKGTQ